MWVHLPRWHFDLDPDLRIEVGDVFEDVALSVAARRWLPATGPDGVVARDVLDDEPVLHTVTGRIVDLSDDFEPILDVGDFEVITPVRLGAWGDPRLGDRLTIVGRLEVLDETDSALVELPDVLGDWRVQGLQVQDRWRAPVRRKQITATGTLPDELESQLYLLDLKLA